MNRKMRRSLGGAVAAIVLLPALLWALLYVPPIQDWVLRRAARQLERQTGLALSYDRLRLTPLLDIEAEGLTATRDGDTLVDVGQATVDLSFRQILRGRLAVDGIGLKDGRLDSRDLWEPFALKGRVGDLWIQARDADLRRKLLTVNDVRLEGCDLDIAVGEQTESDSTESTRPEWRIAVERLAIDDSRVGVKLPSDSISLAAVLNEARLEGAEIRLDEATYAVEKVSLKADSLRYDRGDGARQATGLDTNHLRLSDINLGAESFRYAADSDRLEANLWCQGLREECGLEVTDMKAQAVMERGRLMLREAEIETPHSSLKAEGTMDLSALQRGGKGRMDLEADIRLGLDDLRAATDEKTRALIDKMYRGSQPIEAELRATGNVDSLWMERMRVEIPGVARIEGGGWLTNLADPDRRPALEAEVDLSATDLSMVNRLANSESFRLPRLTMTGKLGMKGDRYSVDALVREGGGKARLTGWYDTATTGYEARLHTDGLAANHFLAHKELGRVWLTAKARGRGFDPFDPKTRLEAEAQVDRLCYADHEIEDVWLKGRVANGRGRLEMKGENELLGLDACAEADMARTLSNAHLDADLRHLAAQKLGLTKDSLTVSLALHAEGESDLRDTHRLEATIKALTLQLPDTTFYPHDLTARLATTAEQMSAAVASGDLQAEAQSGQGFGELRAALQGLMAELEAERRNFCIRQDTLRSLLPNFRMSLRSGSDNPVANILQANGLEMERLEMELRSDTTSGLNGNGRLWALDTGALLLDTISWNLFHEADGLRMEGRVRNGPKNKTVSFESRLAAQLTQTGAQASLLFYDAKGRKGVDLGLQAEMLENGSRIHFEPLNPVLAYRHFRLNEDNFVALTNDRRIEAAVDLLADDGTGIKLYSTPGEALQDLTLSLNHFNVGELANALPYMPPIGGLLHGDFHYVQADSTTLSVSTDMTVRQMRYDGAELGDVGLNAVYLPNADGTHYADGIVTHNGNEVMMLSGGVKTGKGKTEAPEIDGTAQLVHLPLTLANGFIPNGMAQLKGTVDGELQVKGTTQQPLLSGLLTTDAMKLISEPYNLNLAFPNDTLRISQSRIDLDRIEAYTTGRNPLTLDGNVDFRQTDAIRLDVTVRADNYQLINAPKQRNSLAYGKANVDVRSRISGTLDNLKMRGRLNVLGTTDLTYVLEDSPLTVEDRLADLVTFTDFNDTIEAEVTKTKRKFLDMQFVLSIQPSAQLHCLLSETGQDYINLEGGGDLTLSYDNARGMQMNGRYTILSGDMNYTVLPVVGSKHFHIENGSYVEFRDELTNPTLNIRARERMRSTVTENNQPRSVAFDVGLNISQTLENMGLQFTLSAPEDLTVQNQLAAMSDEDRGRVAVTMLATGMYLSDFSETPGFSTSNTLNSYLQNEINNLVGMAQSTIDFNVGIENTTTQSGSAQTDYSFSFAKRFWGNRIAVIVGGKVSSGADAQNTGQSIIDNISIEYRLDQSATRYVRVYYDHNYESLLEGEITEMGAGVVFRRKTERLGELFIFRKKPQETRLQPRTNEPTKPAK